MVVVGEWMARMAAACGSSSRRRGRRRLLLEDHEPCAGGARAERARGGERDDAAADDGQIVPVRHDAIDRARPRACQAPRVLRYHAGAGPAREEAGMRRIFTKKDSERREAKDGHPRSVPMMVEPAPAGPPHPAMGLEALDPGSRIPVHFHAEAEEG